MSLVNPGEELSLSGPVGEWRTVRDGRVRCGTLERLILNDFRSIATADLRFDKGPVLLLGPNGGGKTNILEAISLLAPGRGLRGAKLGDITRRGSNRTTVGWAISAEITGSAGAVRIGTGLAHDSLGRERRLFKFEGEKARPSDIAELVRLVWLVPSMDRLFEESVSGRRRFFDRLVAALDAAHATRLSRYERALSERQRLLTDGAAEPAWLKGLEHIMAEAGVAIAAARLVTIDQLSRQIAAGGPWTEEDLFPRAELLLAGDVETALAARAAVLVEAEFEAALETGRERDAAAGRALQGPHRSDLKVRHIAKNMPAEDCSSGEQKALLLNILLAHVQLIAETASAPPLVLLDEVAAHLDAVRRQALFEALASAGSQVFMTGTDEAAFSALKGAAQIFDVADSQARERRPASPSIKVDRTP